MRSLLRPSNLYLLLTYLVLSAVPFVPMLMGKPVERPWQILGGQVIGWVAAWAIFRRPAYFHWLLLPAFIALPTEIYLYKFYGQGISTHHLGIIAETSPKEAIEFLGHKVWLMLALMVGVLAWFVTTWRAAFKTRDLDWTDNSRQAALVVLFFSGLLLAYGVEFGMEGKPKEKAVASKSLPSGIQLAALKPSASAASEPASSEEEEDEEDVDPLDAVVEAKNWTGFAWPALPYRARMPFDFDAFTRSWPFGLMARTVDFYNERSYLAELNERSASFRFGARQEGVDEQAEIVVMVIGESSRYDRWSLNGYERETNPLLKQEPNIVMLQDVVTAVAATRLSVPVIISRKSARESLQDGFSEKSFLTAYKEAGFKTFWLSNQVSFGQFDTPVSVFAREADVVQFLNLGGYKDNSNHDEILLDPLKIAVKDPAKKKLIVLHSLGSHWNYSQRYPKEFDKWSPSLFGVDKPVYTDTKIKPQLNNSYDATILYTDWFLHNVIGTLKNSGQLASMLYVSDHGQTLYDDTCNLAFHGHNTKFEFHIPAFVWYSEEFKGKYPDKVSNLVRNKGQKLATENMFHTMLDMGNLRYPGEKLERSFVNARFKPHKRYVDSYGWTNYDNATLKGDCREVIDKGKPLKQVK